MITRNTPKNTHANLKLKSLTSPATMVRVRGNTPVKQLRIDLEEFSDSESDTTVGTPRPDPTIFMTALEKPFTLDRRTMAPGRPVKTMTPEQEEPLDLSMQSTGMCIYHYKLFHSPFFY
jgi:hypothetical protein